MKECRLVACLYRGVGVGVGVKGRRAGLKLGEECRLGGEPDGRAEDDGSGRRLVRWREGSQGFWVSEDTRWLLAAGCWLPSDEAGSVTGREGKLVINRRSSLAPASKTAVFLLW